MMPYASGERWELWHGDCIEVMRGMADASADAIITDPPYSVGITYDGYDDSNREAYYALARGFMAEARRICRPDGVIVLTPGHARLTWWYANIPPDWCIAWFKPNACSHNRLGGFCTWEPALIWGKVGRFKLRRDSIHRAIRRQSDTGDHPCPKEIGAWRELFDLLKWPEDPLVLDPFHGSGTTGTVCVERGFRFIGIEQSAKYSANAARRLSSAAVPEALAA